MTEGLSSLWRLESPGVTVSHRNNRPQPILTYNLLPQPLQRDCHRGTWLRRLPRVKLSRFDGFVAIHLRMSQQLCRFWRHVTVPQNILQPIVLG